MGLSPVCDKRVGSLKRQAGPRCRALTAPRRETGPRSSAAASLLPKSVRAYLIHEEFFNQLLRWDASTLLLMTGLQDQTGTLPSDFYGESESKLFVLFCFFFFFLALHRPAHGKSHKLHSVIVLSSRDKKKGGLFVQAGNKPGQNITVIFFNAYIWNLELPWLLSGKESTCQCRRHRRLGFHPWARKISWRRKWQPTPVFLSGESHGQRSLAGYSPWGRTESGLTENTPVGMDSRRMVLRRLFAEQHREQTRGQGWEREGRGDEWRAAWMHVHQHL